MHTGAPTFAAVVDEDQSVSTYFLSAQRALRVPPNVRSRGAAHMCEVQAFEQELKKFGWTIGQNVQIETRWATPNLNEIRKSVAELVALKPDVILAHGSSTVGAFPVAGDPVAGGFVESLARPGGNITGFALFEYCIGAKWLELLKQVAPRVTRAAVLQQVGLPDKRRSMVEAINLKPD